MRRIILFMLALVACHNVEAATPKEWLQRLATTLGTRYAMNMDISISSYDTLHGYFEVEGDGYYLTLGAMEVYSDGYLRYEINNERKEVTEDSVNLASSDLLSNPTRAFTFIDEEYTIVEVTPATAGFCGVSEEEDVVLGITPRDYSLGLDNIYVWLHSTSDGGVVPRAMLYDYDGERVHITLDKVTADGKLPRWDKGKYRTYDIVSFL